MKKNKVKIRAWIKALRSGGYEQCKGALHKNGKYCCLGVGCKVLNKRTRPQGTFLTNQQREIFGLTNAQESKLVEMNDMNNQSFKYIASYIERYVL